MIKATTTSTNREPSVRTASSAVTVSVVIPTHDRREFLSSAVNSVLGQTWLPNEIIIVDNGSEPLELEIESSLIRVLRIKPHAGASAARNYGVSQARGTYIAFLDDDDYWEPRYLEKIFVHSGLPYGTSYIVTALDRQRDGQVEAYRKIKSVSGLLDSLWVTNPGIGGTNSVISRQDFIDCGGFDTGLKTSEDRSLAVRFLQAGKLFHFVPEAHAIARMHDEERLTNPASMIVGKKLFLAKHGAEMPSYARARNRAIIAWFTYKSTRRLSELVSVAWWLSYEVALRGLRCVKATAGSLFRDRSTI